MALSSSTPGTDHWSSRTAFLLAAVGSAVGLGNIWRFPTMAGENGGGAFVLVYIACVVLIGLPMVLAETLIGRAGGGNADSPGSIAEVARRSRVSTKWSFFGFVGLGTAFLILSFYSVVAGWVLYFIWLSGADLLSALLAGDPFRSAFAGTSQEELTGFFGNLLGRPGQMLLQHALFMGVTLAIVASGVVGGIERAAEWLMPSFFVLLLLITLYGAVTGSFAEAAAFLFTPDFSRITPAVVNDALGQAFFSLSVGGAILVTYGSYVPARVNLSSTVAVIALIDTLVAIVAGLMIFPIVFSAGLDPAGGPGLIFNTLPVAFQQMPAGALIGFAFFILIFFAALTSSIALLETAVALVIRRFGLARKPTAVMVGLLAFVIGVASVLGYNVWSDVRPLSFWPAFADADILDSVDDITGKIGLPLAALGIAVFSGWRINRSLLETESGLPAPLFAVWRFLIAWLVPLAVCLILLFGLFPSLLV